MVTEGRGGGREEVPAPSNNFIQRSFNRPFLGMAKTQFLLSNFASKANKFSLML